MKANILDIRDSEKRIAYEEAFYEAFSRAYDPTLDSIWIVDHDLKRIKPRIHYSNVIPYVLWVNNVISGGCIVNTNLNIGLQLEIIGFEIDKTRPNIVESLAFFNNKPLYKTKFTLPVLVEFMFNDLKEKGYKEIYITTGEAKANRYKLLGWKALDKRHFGDYTEWLMRYDL